MKIMNGFGLFLVAVALVLLNCSAQAQTTEQSRKEDGGRELITFNCSADLVQLANTSNQECHEIHRKFNRTHFFTTEASVDATTDLNEIDEEDDDEEEESDDGFTTEPTETSSQGSNRFNRRQRWRRLRKQRKMAIKKCVYDKIKENNQVKELITQCGQRVLEHGNVENREKRDQFCVVKAVYRNCLPKDKKPKHGRRLGQRRFFRRQQQ